MIAVCLGCFAGLAQGGRDEWMGLLHRTIDNLTCTLIIGENRGKVLFFMGGEF